MTPSVVAEDTTQPRRATITLLTTTPLSDESRDEMLWRLGGGFGLFHATKHDRGGRWFRLLARGFSVPTHLLAPADQCVRTSDPRLGPDRASRSAGGTVPVEPGQSHGEMRTDLLELADDLAREIFRGSPQPNVVDITRAG